MSIASEITRLQTAKSDLATSIANKGVTVPANATLDDYAALVDSIQQGGAPVLPYDAEVEYIGVRQGVWTELSDYVPTGNGISVDMVATFLSYPTSDTYAIWFAARVDASHLSYRVIRASGNAIICNNANVDSNNLNINYTFNSNTKYHIHMGSRAIEISNVGGSVTYRALNTNYTGTVNTNGFIIGDYAATRGINLNVHSFTVRDFGIVVLDYIPVRVGQVGYFYDKIRKKLYGKNADSITDLVVGNDIN